MNGYPTPDLYDEIQSAQREETAAYLGLVRDRLSTEGQQVETVSREGSPAETILDLADERGVAAIVMATHGRGGLGRLALGSVAERVLGRAEVPLFLVRGQSAPPAASDQPVQVLVPLDGSPLAEHAIDLARDVAPPGASVLLVRVVPSVERPLPAVGVVGTYVDQGATQYAVSQAQAYLEAVASRLAAGSLAVQTGVRVGRPADEILAAAQETAASLIVLSTHGRTGPQRWVIGSVADEVVRHAGSPVLLLSARVLAARLTGTVKVSDLMTRDLAVVGQDEPLLAALRKLLRRGVGGAPVVDPRGKLVGVLSEHDFLTRELGMIQEVARDPGTKRGALARRLEETTVGQVMSHPPVSVEESAPLTAAVRLFVERRLRRLPVTREGHLVGVLTRADVLRAVGGQWESLGDPGPASSAGTEPERRS
jgi:nucleotide-binding universal stress UspA family protein/predicted transcriptional regulator